MDDSKTHHVCPWYLAYLFDNPLRRLIHDPAKILGPYLGPGVTALDLGCGMGFFSLGMARLVGEEGKVISVDLQPQMLRIVEKRARRKGLLDRIQTRLNDGGPLGLDREVDLALCFWMIHEVPDQAALLSDLHTCVKRGGHLFVAEPTISGHVTRDDLQASVNLALEKGFVEVARPKVRMSGAVVFRK